MKNIMRPVLGAGVMCHSGVSGHIWFRGGIQYITDVLSMSVWGDWVNLNGVMCSNLALNSNSYHC